jgi:transposase
MFLRATKRVKDGKEHHYYSVVENRRLHDGKTVQKTVLYLGEINDAQRDSWCEAIEVFKGGERRTRQLKLFASESVSESPRSPTDSIRVDLSRLELKRPREWGASWLAVELWKLLELDEFWGKHLSQSRKGTNWVHVLLVLVVYRLLDPGSEWRLHRLWYERSALSDILGADFSLAQKNTLYRCLDKVLEHKEGFFSHLKQRWEDMFGLKYEVLLYDLTSTYFESSPPHSGEKRRYGYSRDKRSDCVQVVIALIVTPEGFPLAYEVLPGNTSDKTTLRGFLEKIEQQWGVAERIWVMDRGVPTEEILREMRDSGKPVKYIVGTPKGRLSALEEQFLEQPWSSVREGVRVKLIREEGEIYVLARSAKRSMKERAIRQRKLKKLWATLKKLEQQKLSSRQLLLHLGAAKNEAGRFFSLVQITYPELDTNPSFSFSLNKQKLKEVRRREGSYLLRSNITEGDPAELWNHYIQLTEIEQAFKELKGDLSVRPVFHQKEERIEAHIFIAFIAYTLQVTLRQRCRARAGGLTPRSVFEQLAGIQMLDLFIPTSDGRVVKLKRYTKPEAPQQLILTQLQLTLPEQPPPEISLS